MAVGLKEVEFFARKGIIHPWQDKAVKGRMTYESVKDWEELTGLKMDNYIHGYCDSCGYINGNCQSCEERYG